MPARISERMTPGVVYTTFHFPTTGANVITTEHSDWATNCPEYKVTAVQVTPAVVDANGKRRNGTRRNGDRAVSEPVGNDPASEYVRMANDIAAQFARHDREVAIGEVLNHLRNYWEPHMRAQLVAVIERDDSAAQGLSPLALAAAEQLRSAVPA